MYTFMIVAENGISQEFPDQFSEDDRTISSVLFTTQKDGQFNKTT